MPARIARREFAKGVVDRAIRAALATLDRKPRAAFKDFLWRVQFRSDLLRPARSVGRAVADDAARVVRGLLALVEHRREWLRGVDQWEPEGRSPLATFSSLAHHLFAEYPVPPVLLSAWFLGPDWRGICHRRRFVMVGRGRSLRDVNFPLRLTRRSAREFAAAPAGFSIDFALRWAEVRGLGGTDALARAVASTRLGSDFSDQEFWASVIRLFVNTPRVAPAEVAAIVDYLEDRKFTPVRLIIGEATEVEFAPPEPDLSIKGRTVASLLRRVEHWRAERRPEGPERRLLRWPASGIEGYRAEVGPGVALTVGEILDSDALVAEGLAMHHCVATYADQCLRRESTIWSLGQEGPEGRTRLATIEVDPTTRRIVQSSAPCNETPDLACMATLHTWAAAAGLAIDRPDDPVP